MRKILIVPYQVYKFLILFPIIILSTLVIGTLVVIVSAVYSPKFASTYLAGAWARVNSFFTPMFVSVLGKNNINKKQSYVIMPNHQSHYDIFVIYGWLGVDLKWVMKKELRKVPMLGYACEKMQHIFLDRSDREKAIETLKNAKHHLADGSSVVIFPEGTRSQSEVELLPFKKGPFKMAFDLGLPILPVTIMGTRKIMPTESFTIFPGRAKMIVHPAIDIKNYNENNLEKLMVDVTNIIKQPLKN